MHGLDDTDATFLPAQPGYPKSGSGTEGTPGPRKARCPRRTLAAPVLNTGQSRCCVLDIMSHPPVLAFLPRVSDWNYPRTRQEDLYTVAAVAWMHDNRIALYRAGGVREEDLRVVLCMDAGVSPMAVLGRLRALGVVSPGTEPGEWRFHRPHATALGRTGIADSLREDYPAGISHDQRVRIADILGESHDGSPRAIRAAWAVAAVL